MDEISKLLVDLSQVVTAIAIAGAFIYAGLTYRSSKISEQIKRSYDSLKDLTALQTSLIEHPEQYSDSGAMKQWYERYFNTWEWFSFMVNKKQIKEKKITQFFRHSALSDYENIFRKQYTQQQIDNDAEFYPEFKKLYKKLKNDS